MEVSGAVSRRLPSLFRPEIARSSMEISGADARRSATSSSLSVSGGSVGTGTRDFGHVGRRNVDSYRFFDDGDLRYYDEPRCLGVRLKKQKEAVKKKLKLLKGLSGDLSVSCESGFVLRFDDGSVGEFQADRFSIDETRAALERQLQQLKSKEKEQKRKRKLEKAKQKAARVQTMHESSSSSSESSDNETNTTNTNHRISKALSFSLSQPFPDHQWQTNAIQGSTFPPPLQTHQPNSNTENVGISQSASVGRPFPDHQWQTNTIPGSTLPPPLQTHQPNSNTENVGVSQSASVGRVEVCMGNKCKKAGAAALMEEFERVMGADGAVCGCKCMGKCRDGPNVRVSDSVNTEAFSANPLCIGVRVEDVGRIVAGFVEQGEQKQSRFAPTI